MGSSSPFPILAMLAAGLLLSASPALAARRLADAPAAANSTGAGAWTLGRATWYDSPQLGSCGLGKLDSPGYKFQYDAVAALPDTSPFYPTSCGMCFEIKCRGIQAISADGAVNLDRSKACLSESKTIVVKITDTCPAAGNEKWCAGDMPHLDLSDRAFSRLASRGDGIIGLHMRPVPCEVASGNATPGDWTAFEQALQQGGSPDIFVGGEAGMGWIRSMYGDSVQAMYTYDNAIVVEPDGGVATCDSFKQYGGMDWHLGHLDAPGGEANQTFFGSAAGVEFWAKTSEGMPGLTFRLANMKMGACANQYKMATHATDDVANGYTRFYFPLGDMGCGGQSVPASRINRVQWENQEPSEQALCLKDVRVVMGQPGSATAPVASAGRR